MASPMHTRSLAFALRVLGVFVAITAPVWLTLALAAASDALKSPRTGLITIVAIASTLNSLRLAANLNRAYAR